MGRKSIPPLVLKDILRLRANELSFREIGERCGLSHTAVRLYYQQAQARPQHIFSTLIAKSWHGKRRPWHTSA